MKIILTSLTLLVVSLKSFAQPCTASSAGTINATCNGICDGVITISTTGGTPPYQVFHPGTGIPMTYTSTIMFTGLCAGTYSLFVMDNTGCPETLVATILEPTALSLLTSSNPESFPGACDGTIFGNVSGGTPSYSFNVTPFLPGGFPPYTNVCGGNYTVCVTDANGCMTCQPVFVGNSCAVTTTTDATIPASCFGTCDGSATITASSGAAPYTVSGSFPGSPITFTTSTTLNGLCAGTLSLTIEDNNGCTDNHTVVISEPGEIFIALSSTDATAGNCDGSATANVTGGASPYMISWYECVTNNPIGIVGQFLTGACPGDYYVEVTDANGCTATSTCVTIDEQICDVTSSVLNQTDVSCNGDCNGTVLIQATGGQPPYIADPGNGTTIMYTSVGTITGLCAGTYDIITTDVNGCADTVTVTISEPPVLVASATETDASGPGICDGILDGTATGGTPAYTFDWVNCTTLLSVGTTEDVPNVCAGEYFLTVTDANGCIDTTDCVTISDSIDDSGFLENTVAFKIYPNPVSDQLTIQTDATDFRFEIVNTLGELVYVSNSIASNTTTISLRTAGLSEGLYVVRLYVGDVISVTPLVIQGD